MSGENHSFGFKGIPNRICKKTVAQAPKFGKLERRKTLNQPCKSKAPEFFTDDYLVRRIGNRMGKTASALVAARSRLSGDSDFGYSNLLGVLSALVSHEHHAMIDDVFVAIMKALEGDKEHSFRLAEKITLARLKLIDAAQA